jgi:amino acid adenylation domain-containing protein
MKSPVPASYHQERLWFIDQFEAGNLYPHSPVYHNIPLILEINGSLNIDRLEQGIRQVIGRHEALRTRIITQDNRPFQQIRDEADFKLERLKSAGRNRQTGGSGDRSPKAAAVELAVEISRRPFKLDSHPLVRGTLIQWGPQDFILVITLHHVVADRCSLDIFLREMLFLYRQDQNGESPGLPELPAHYADFSRFQHRLPPRLLKPLLIYWQKQLRGRLQPLELPTDRPRAPIHRFREGRLSFDLPQFAPRQGIDTFVWLLAAFKVLLYKYAGSEEIVVGTSSRNRSQPGTGGMIGPVANLLVLRSRFSGHWTVERFVREVDRTVRDARRYQALPFDRLVNQLNPDKDMSRTALFDVLFQYEESPLHIGNTRNPDDLRVRVIETNLGWGKYDLNMLLQKQAQSFSGVAVYNRDYYDEATIAGWCSHYQVVLEEMLSHPQRALSELQVMTHRERACLLREWSGREGQVGYRRQAVLPGLFADRVRKAPHQVALTGMEGQLSYRRLDNRAHRLSAHLRSRGVAPGSIVALLLERTAEMVAAVLAVLKAGAAYLPLDPGYPEERIQFMLTDSHAALLLTSENTGGSCLPEPGCVPPQASAPSPASPAYVIYTSGTTGRPKGVVVEHRQVVSLFFNDGFPFDFNSRDVWPLFHSYCFDFSVWEMYGALLLGGRLILLPRMVARDTHRCLEVLRREQATVLNQTPSAFYRLLEEELTHHRQDPPLPLRYVIFGGEALHPARLLSWGERYPRTRLINMFGITETTVHVTYKEITAAEMEAGVSNIGRPLPTLSTYIMDQQGMPVPVGAAGELYVGGAGVCRGYLNRPELTAEKFMDHPQVPGERLYRSGDRLRFLANRDMLYLGRLDHQVQLRGFRIELGEIESQLLGHEAVREAVVIDREDESRDPYLCAYIVCPSTVSVVPNDFRQYLARRLPDYMMPSHFVPIDRIPLTVNGKLDRSALPEPRAAAVRERLAPRDEVEKKLARVWGEVLAGKEGYDGSFGITDNFFDLGGHSLKAATLVSRIHQAFDVRIPLAEVFKTPFIRDLAGYIKKSAVADRFMPIVPVEEKAYYPLSSAQKRMYILQQLARQGSHYNLTSVKEIGGEVDPERIKAVFSRLIHRHGSLRTSFHMVAGQPVQRIHPHVEFEVAYYDLAAKDAKGREGIHTLEGIIGAFIRPFDLSKPPLLRLGLIKWAGDSHFPARYILILDMHHIVTDGISMETVKREVLELYRGGELPPLRMRYRDFSEWQNSRAYRESLKGQEEYWLHQFEDQVPRLHLPTDFGRPPERDFEGSTISFGLTRPQVSRLREMVQETGCTLFMILLSVYYIFLSRLSGQEDIVIGIPVAGRGHADLGRIVGMFVNSLALRNFPAAGKEFIDFLTEVKNRLLEAFENQDYPFEELVEKVAVPEDTGRNPIFEVMFTVQSSDGTGAVGLPEIHAYDYEYRVAKFDLGLGVVEDGDDVMFYYNYSTRLFKEETSRRYVEYLKRIAASVLESPHTRIADIEMMPEHERRRLLFDFNRAPREYAGEGTAQECFEAAVDRFPHRAALVFADWQHSYGHLNESANRLAHWLRQQMLGPGRMAALRVGRSTQMIALILGILKAGGAYLPIDPEYPARLTGFVLHDSEAEILLTDGAAAAAPDFKCRVLCPPWAEVADCAAANPDHVNGPADPAYVIYTSGSTGTPKGVVVDHCSLLAYVKSGMEEFPQTVRDVRTQHSSIAFDQFVEEVFPLLFCGGKLVILDKYEAADPEHLKGIFRRHAVTLFSTVPAVLKGLNEAAPLPPLKRVIVGGDVLKPGHIARIVTEVPVFNFYGPTETTVCAAHYRCCGQDGAIIPVGKPRAGYQVYILDSLGRPLPIGITGEICISGRGVARGYLNRPELTAQRFVPHPFLPGRRLYRTGDLGRWLPDGNIVMSGRRDFQVKIRGFRIEPGEIEYRLQRHPEVKEVVVDTRTDGGGQKYLCAYVVPAGSPPPEPADPSLGRRLKEYLSGELPGHMIPAYFVFLAQLPCTPQGKVNRRGLPGPDLENRRTGAVYAPPVTGTQRALAAIWQRVLKLKGVGIDDRFFDCGGNSLNVMTLLADIHREMGVQLPVSAVFEKQTIRLLADSIGEGEKSLFSPLKPGEVREYYPASSLQRRFFILSQAEGIAAAYNMPEVKILEGEIDAGHFEEIFRLLIRRHEGLRTSFEWIDSDLVQRLHRQVGFEIEYYALAGETGSNEIVREFIRPFDLSRPPLLRAALVKLADNRHLLLYDIHHIVADGTSLIILAQEFFQVKRGEALLPLKIQYRDFCRWQQTRLETGEWQAQQDYWLNRFGGEIPDLTLPTDYPRPAVQSFEGDTVRFSLKSDTMAQIKALMRETDTTLFMVLLAVYNVLLSRYSGQEDIVVGSPIAGRDHADLKGVVGLFMNVMALRHFPAATRCFADFLQEVRQTSLEAFENRDYPFGELLEKLDIKRDLSRSPLFSAEFLMQNMESPDTGETGLNLGLYGFDMTSAQADVSLVVMDLPEETRCSLIYCRRLFRRETMERFAGHFLRILAEVLDDPTRRLKDIEMLSAGEVEAAGLEEINKNHDSGELEADFAF